MRYADFNTMDFVASKGDFGRGVHPNGDFGNYGFNIADMWNSVFTSSEDKQSTALQIQAQQADVQRKKMITLAIAGVAIVGLFIVAKKMAK